MKFLIDEDVPAKLIQTLKRLNHDVARVEPSSIDLEIARRAKKEDRILITLDKDFTNTATYPPSEFNIIRIQIHPPYENRIAGAVEKLLKTLAPHEIKGLIILFESGHLRFS